MLNNIFAQRMQAPGMNRGGPINAGTFQAQAQQPVQPHMLGVVGSQGNMAAQPAQPVQPHNFGIVGSQGVMAPQVQQPMAQAQAMTAPPQMAAQTMQNPMASQNFLQRRLMY